MADWILGQVESFETWLRKKGMALENRFKNWEASAVQRKKMGLRSSLSFPAFGLFAMLLEMAKRDHIDWGCFLVLITAPALIGCVGISMIEAIQKSMVQKVHSVVVELIFFLLSIGVSLSIGFTGMGSIALVILGIFYVVWASLLEMIFGLATPIGLIGIAVSSTISVTLNVEGSHYNGMICIPILLGVIHIIFSWRYNEYLFCYPPEENR